MRKKNAKQIYIKIRRMDHKHKSDKTEKATILDLKKKKKKKGGRKLEIKGQPFNT